jgi:hypothetical protein
MMGSLDLSSSSSASSAAADSHPLLLSPVLQKSFFGSAPRDADSGR